ncbi:hypothetical protein [Desulfopila sp. IMCC35008]|uniref:hypothetical protein n=1 Tax=Desulfopila sp. IMCC35008 TaxID=2653858 RepID=UPI0013CF9E98|nr:hypothetical protein [Desulfopila sp. IMCC35008]
MNRLSIATFLFAFMASPPAYADNWQPFTGADTLKEFVSGATAQIELTPGVTAVGTYHADGTAEIEAWNEIFRRTWSVKGDDQVCYSDVETNCFSFEQNQGDPAEYRARNVATGEMFMFRVTDDEARTFSSETSRDSEGGFGSPSAAEVAAALSDPNTNMGTMNFQFDYISYDGDIPGADGAEAWRMLFQPSLPYKLTDSSNLFIRPAIPVIFSQDVPQQSGGFSSEGVDLGDIGFDASLAKTFPGGIVILAGLAGTLPTATNDSLGLDQWLLGPEFAVAMVRPWGVVGTLVSHQWDVAGEGDYDTSITGGQYFYALNLKDGWQINGSPTFSYNHEASSGNEWTFPLAVGASKTTFIGGRPWKFGLQYWHYIESPDNFGPEYQIRFTVSPVVKLPW